jgi:hypothetical protein
MIPIQTACRSAPELTELFPGVFQVSFSAAGMILAGYTAKNNVIVSLEWPRRQINNRDAMRPERNGSKAYKRKIKQRVRKIFSFKFYKRKALQLGERFR